PARVFGRGSVGVVVAGGRVVDGELLGRIELRRPGHVCRVCPPTSARDDRWLGRGIAFYGRGGGRGGFLGGGGHSVGESEDRQSRQRSVGTHSHCNSSRRRQQSAVRRSALALLAHLVAPRGLGRAEVHTVRGKGKCDM